MSSKFETLNDVTGIIHVGAHRGEEVEQYADMGAKTVIWVEPNPDVFKEMKHFLTSVGASIDSHAFEYAVSDVDHDNVDFHLYYGPDAGFMRGNKGCSSLLKAKGRFESWHQETIKVETITIDTLLTENDFKPSDFQLLNLDVQGAELLALKGASEVLKYVKYVATEATWQNPDYVDNVMYDDLKSFLESKGFIETEIVNHGPDWGDVLFVKEG
tara:strand:- start:478 stop:1119 length:642 start_codon:yes stop_codon:yes gene_type:complete